LVFFSVTTPPASLTARFDLEPTAGQVEA